MKSAAIICEFDPLHTGHKRLIDFAKTVADKVICIMSGNFTQRGLPACADKYARARHAVTAGADIVVELPTVFATASAENFAYGGVYIAQKMGADFLVFGSECGDMEKLLKCAEMIDDAETQKKIREEIGKGVSYPKAVALATGTELLDKPNNTLAIEYIRALRFAHASIIPLTIKREDNYNEIQPAQYASSSMLRKNVSLRDRYTFDYVAKDIDDNVVEKYCNFVTSALSLATKERLALTEGVTEGLENRIVNADKTQGFGKMTEQIKTKRYTRLRLQRVYLDYLLGIDKNTVAESKKNFPPIKVLAANKSSVQLIAKTEKDSDPVTQRADRLYYSFTGGAPLNSVQIIEN